jgi:hypothetical protein
MPTADTIRGVHARAQLNTPEGETARAILTELERQFPDLAREADFDDAEGKRWFEAPNWHKQQLITRVGWYLGCVAFTVKRQRGILLKGPNSLLGAVEPIVSELWKKILEIHKGATIGFLMGALPPSDSIKERIEPKGDDKDPKPMSPTARSAMWRTADLGRDSRPRRSLTSGG